VLIEDPAGEQQTPATATARRAATMTRRRTRPAPPGRSAPAPAATVTGTPTVGTRFRPARRISSDASATTSRAIPPARTPGPSGFDAPHRGSRCERRGQRRRAPERGTGVGGDGDALAGVQRVDPGDEMAGFGRQDHARVG
jgi:hypothetical protein